MDLDPVCPIPGFDEAFPTVQKPQLGINDIKSIIDDSNSSFIDTMSILTAQTANMSDDSWFGRDDIMDNGMNDVIYHYGNYDAVVYQVPAAKIIPQSVDWTPASVMLASSISSATNHRVFWLLFDSGGSDNDPLASITQGLSRATCFKSYQNEYPCRIVHTQIHFPEFDNGRFEIEHKTFVFKGDCRYDVIWGGDFLTKVGMLKDTGN